MRAASAGPAKTCASTGRRLIANVRREVDRLNGAYTRTLEKAGVDLFMTRATLDDPHTVQLAGRDASSPPRPS